MPLLVRQASDPRWLLLIHQIPPDPGYLRVKIGRRLGRLGAVAIKNSVYALPGGERAHEDFQWVRREILEGGGDATVCEARFVDGLADDQVEALFNVAREVEYQAISQDARRLRASFSRRKRVDENLKAEVTGSLRRLRKRLAEVGTIDFFGASGAQTAHALLAEIDARLAASTGPARANSTPQSEPVSELRGRTWVTRKGVHVDRMASAWLVRRFVDAEAKFKFVIGRGYRPEPGEIRFDMFDAEFTHEGDRCTFEVLLHRIGADDPALGAVAEIVHEIDLRDAKYDRPETAGIERLIAGIAVVERADEARLTRSAPLFDALYEALRRKSSRREGDA